ncbi:hypothetical protein [Hyphomicrobium sp. D-2]|uniref:hypothetical protein n=1 Tax=Hyphomicrobium sp. D-2 TaxID=3041621 RepID=UPI0024564BA0|nr:hypothetical protein [Hyphomicrobium sp. D-2]MDH4982150.1 hypothetical protein [Hyphomicrobium sp. D-2]
MAAAFVGIAALSLSDNPATTELDTAAQAGREPAATELRPSLDCAFRPANHNSIYFYFDVAMNEGAEPRFFERAVVFGDGSRRAYEGDDRPVWNYSVDADGNATIASQSDETRIILYGLRMDIAGVWPVEAGIRSPVFFNLGGECRQANLVSARSTMSASGETMKPAAQ